MNILNKLEAAFLATTAIAITGAALLAPAMASVSAPAFTAEHVVVGAETLDDGTEAAVAA